MEYIQPALGFIVLVSLALVFSSDIKAVKIKYITIAMLLQIGLALLFINCLNQLGYLKNYLL